MQKNAGPVECRRRGRVNPVRPQTAGPRVRREAIYVKPNRGLHLVLPCQGRTRLFPRRNKRWLPRDCPRRISGCFPRGRKGSFPADQRSVAADILPSVSHGQGIICSTVPERSTYRCNARPGRPIPHGFPARSAPRGRIPPPGHRTGRRTGGGR